MRNENRELSDAQITQWENALIASVPLPQLYPSDEQLARSNAALEKAGDALLDQKLEDAVPLGNQEPSKQQLDRVLGIMKRSTKTIQQSDGLTHAPSEENTGKAKQTSNTGQSKLDIQPKKAPLTPLVSVFAMAAGIVLAVILWPAGNSSGVLHQDLQAFHAQLDASGNNDNVGSFSQAQKAMGLVSAGETHRFVAWGRDLSVLFRLQSLDKEMQLAAAFERLARESSYRGTNDTDKLRGLTAWLADEAKKSQQGSLFEAGILLMNINLASFQSSFEFDQFNAALGELYARLPEEVQTEHLHKRWESMQALLKNHPNTEQRLAIRNLSAELINFLQL